MKDAPTSTTTPSDTTPSGTASLVTLTANSTRVTVQDIRAARYCLPGVRPWFRRHGLDWQAFLDSGIEASRLRATGDALVQPVISCAEVREQAQAIAEARAQADAELRHGR